MKILRYIFTISILLALPLATSAQESNSKNCDSSLAFKGIGISADLYGGISTLFNDYISGEIAINANIGNRFFPIVEIGYGSTDTTDEITGIYYKSAAPYYRVGLNYNFFYNKKGKLEDYRLYALARYGMTTAEYDVTTPPITDPAWGGTASLDLKGVKSSCSWFELGVGVEAKICKNFYMGWSVRYKTLINADKGKNSDIWYIPGYGENKSGCFGATYSLIYNIPFGK